MPDAEVKDWGEAGFSLIAVETVESADFLKTVAAFGVLCLFLCVFPAGCGRT